MLLEGSSARVLQCSPSPTDTGAVFNSFSKQSCLHTNRSLSPYLCPAAFKKFCSTSKDMSPEPLGFFRHICFLGAWKYLTFYQYRQWNSVKLCIFLVGCHPSDWILSLQKNNSRWLAFSGFAARFCQKRGRGKVGLRLKASEGSHRYECLLSSP